MKSKTATTAILEEKDDNIVEKSDLFYVRVMKKDFTKEHNPVLKKNRIDYIPTNILKVWIKRHIMYYKGDDEYFGISEENNEIVVWFKYEEDCSDCEKLFKQIKENGFPRAKII